MIRTELVSWYWHRLRAMNGAEIAGRIAEKTRALGERRAREELEAFRLGPACGESARWLPNAGEAPASVREVVARRAAAVREGRWQLYGWKEVRVSDPPDWGWDAMQDRHAPLEVPVAGLDHRRLASGADPRSIWEINRWGELVVLAQNAWLNGVVEDARRAQRWLADWVARNELGHGINWTSALEAGLRLMQFTWIDQMLRSHADAEVRVEQERLAAKIVPGHAWWVWRHRSMGSSANNHLLGELAGLILAARRWPSLVRLTCCAEKAWQELQEQVLIQFAEDGGNREQALHYHVFAWELAWQCQRVMGGGGAEFLERMSQAGWYFAALAHGEEPWDFGDSDDGEVGPWTRERGRATAEWRGWFLGGADGEALRYWLGAAPVQASEEELTKEWVIFPKSGQAVGRCGPWMARLDASPLGFGSMAAHGHLDALHASVWWGAQAVMVDPGTGAYYSDAALRARLADWSAHNGPVPCQGRPAPRRAGPFLWTAPHESPRLRVADGQAVGCLACDGPFVERGVRMEAAGVEVTDRVCNSLRHRVSWTLAPGWGVVKAGDRAFRLTHEGGAQLRLELSSPGQLEGMVEETVVSCRFLQTETAVVVRVAFSGELKTRILEVAARR